MPKVTAIPPTKTLYPREPISLNRKQRVAAYARVSTEQEEQQSSYNLEKVNHNEDEKLNTENTLEQSGRYGTHLRESRSV